MLRLIPGKLILSSKSISLQANAKNKKQKNNCTYYCQMNLFERLATLLERVNLLANYLKVENSCKINPPCVLELKKHKN